MITIRDIDEFVAQQVQNQGSTQIVINATVSASSREPTTYDWAQVAMPAFARDWDSDADRQYDDLH